MGILACTSCRSRKVACDRRQPSCSRCLLSGKICEFRVRKSTKPVVHSRVKDFEARLGGLESQLHRERAGHSHANKAITPSSMWYIEEERQPNLKTSVNPQRVHTTLPSRAAALHLLPCITIQEELYHLYFQRVHPLAPMIHKFRFYRALDASLDPAPLVALRFAMWATAALVSTQYEYLAEKLYMLGRKYAEDAEMACPPNQVSPSHAQCWYLLSSYEASRGYLNRAWMSVGRCVRLVQMMSLHRLDDPNDPKHFFHQGSWAEKEEGRRVFWASYLGDRWASTMSGDPLIIRDEDICTNLPVSEESFNLEREELGMPLPGENDVDSLTSTSPFGGSIFSTTIVGKCLNYLQTYEHVATSKLTSKFWISHQQMDTSISLMFLNMPNQLRASQADGDVNVVMSQFNLHVTVILLHQFAVKIAVKQNMEHNVRQNSFQRCLASALEIKNITHSLGDLTTFSGSIWITFCIYIAACIFIEDMLTNFPSPSSAVDLGLLLIALQKIDARQSYTGFFASKLASDIARTGVASRIPADLRGVAGITVPQQAGNGSRSLSRGPSYCNVDG